MAKQWHVALRGLMRATGMLLGGTRARPWGVAQGHSESEVSNGHYFAVPGPRLDPKQPPAVTETAIAPCSEGALLAHPRRGKWGDSCLLAHAD